MALNLQQIYGGNGSPNVAPPMAQGQGGTGTATTSNGAAGSLVAGTLGWWLALVAGLVAVRVLYEVKGRFD